MDANRNGLVERVEATGAARDRFGAFDFNNDSVLSGAEFARGSLNDVDPPTTLFADRHTVTLVGKRVTLIHLGDAHAVDSVVLHFPDERAVFSADILQVRRLPGHALASTKKDAADLLRYLEDISTGVAAGIAAGRGRPEIQKTLTLDAYKGFERWDTIRTAHIAAVYATIKGAR